LTPNASKRAGPRRPAVSLEPLRAHTATATATAPASARGNSLRVRALRSYWLSAARATGEVDSGLRLGHQRREFRSFGGVAEWSKAAVLKNENRPQSDTSSITNGHRENPYNKGHLAYPPRTVCSMVRSDQHDTTHPQAPPHNAG
jgi:hypothetical protein